MQLGYSVAVTVAVAGICSSDSTLAWELPYAAGAALKKTNKKNSYISLKHTMSWKLTFICFSLILERCLFNHGAHGLMTNSPSLVFKVYDLTTVYTQQLLSFYI